MRAGVCMHACMCFCICVCVHGNIHFHSNYGYVEIHLCPNFWDKCKMPFNIH